MPPLDLTPRELDVIRGIVAGCTNREIARDLGLSVQAVKNVLSTVYQKCHVRSRLELAIFALHHRAASERRKNPHLRTEVTSRFNSVRRTVHGSAVTLRWDLPPLKTATPISEDWRHVMLRRLFIPSLTLAIAGAVPVAMYSAADESGVEPPRSDQSHRRHLRGEPQLRQLVWIVGRGQRAAECAPRHTTQINQSGTPFSCLLQNDPSLTTPPLSPLCTDATTATPFTSHFVNAPFTIDDYIQPTSTTCPDGVPNGQPGGCTRDLVHRFYQEQFQLHGGRQDRYVTGSDAVGLTMGTYDTRMLPVYKIPARGRASALCRGGCILPVCVRWIVPESPVADRGGDAGLAERGE